MYKNYTHIRITNYIQKSEKTVVQTAVLFYYFNTILYIILYIHVYIFIFILTLIKQVIISLFNSTYLNLIKISCNLKFIDIYKLCVYIYKYYV